MRVHSKQAGFLAAEVADVTRSADFARCDWLNDTAKGAKLFRRVGVEHAPALATAVYASFGVETSGPAAKAALRKVKGNRKRLSPKHLAALNEYERVAQSVRRIKLDAFGRKAARKAAKKFQVSRAAKGLVGALKALGYGVKLTSGPAK
jgi:hypothetical protein